MTLFMVAAALVMLLGSAGLAIDLVSLYVARSEAQRAADSAALAAARRLVESNVFMGVVTQGEAEVTAETHAITMAAQNGIYGDAVVITGDDIVFDWTVPTNPTVSVQVQRTSANGNPMPTLFMKVFGVNEADVRAVATAEAYVPTEGGPGVCIGCIKPWIMPNCDPNEDHDNEGPTTYCGENDRFVDNDGNIINPGLVEDGGVVGYEFLLKAGDPHDAPAPSQFYPIQIPPGETPEICKECAASGGGSDGPGAALYRHNIACCNTNQFVCGATVDVELNNGNMVGPTRAGTRCLINQGNGNSFPNGQDTFDPTTFKIFAGTANPYYPAGTEITTSDSIVTIPLYDGHDLCPGNSCGSSVTIVGFLQVFIKQTENGNQGTVWAYIMSVSGCGEGGSEPSCDEPDENTVTGGQFVPVRLIRNPAGLTFPPPAP
jgi:hypothetical protein